MDNEQVIRKLISCYMFPYCSVFVQESREVRLCPPVWLHIDEYRKRSFYAHLLVRTSDRAARSQSLAWARYVTMLQCPNFVDHSRLLKATFIVKREKESLSDAACLL